VAVGSAGPWYKSAPHLRQITMPAPHHCKTAFPKVHLYHNQKLTGGIMGMAQIYFLKSHTHTHNHEIQYR